MISAKNDAAKIIVIRKKVEKLEKEMAALVKSVSKLSAPKKKKPRA